MYFSAMQATCIIPVTFTRDPHEALKSIMILLFKK